MEQPKTILTIDDDDGVRKTIQLYLSRNNYRVVTAANGHQGLEVFAAEKPDMVITDLFMPEKDGFAVLAHLTANAPDTPVIVISGLGQLGDAIRALRLGAWDYIYKPIEEISFLGFTVEKTLKKAELIRENRAYRDHLEAMVAEKTAQLAQSEEKYRTVAHFTHDWEYWIMPDGAFKYLSPSCQRITGYAMAEFFATPSLILDITHPEDREILANHGREPDNGTNACELDFRIFTRDGRLRWINHTCRPIFDAAGVFLGRRGSNRDITWRKEMENKLRLSQAELEEKTLSLERMNMALKAMLDQREIEKQSVETSMVANLKRFVFPYLDSLVAFGLNTQAQSYLNIIRTNIEELIAPTARRLPVIYQDFTPAEVAVADLIREGKSTKDIAGFLKSSPSTVAIHRNNIRKKLGLLNQKTNLQTYLNSLAK